MINTILAVHKIAKKMKYDREFSKTYDKYLLLFFKGKESAEYLRAYSKNTYVAAIADAIEEAYKDYTELKDFAKTTANDSKVFLTEGAAYQGISVQLKKLHSKGELYLWDDSNKQVTPTMDSDVERADPDNIYVIKVGEFK